MKNLQLVATTLVTILGLAITIRATTMPADGLLVESAPTVYSNDHAIAQLRAKDEGQAATF